MPSIKTLCNLEIVCALMAAILSSSCVSQDGTTPKAAAKVDGATISQQAVATSAPDADATGRLKQLDVFVNQQLMANAAIADKLDADAKVIVAMEMAKRQILAQAYLAKLTLPIPKPTDDETRAFYDKNPELFSKRRSYRLMEFICSVPAERIDEVTTRFKNLKTLNERTDWLKQAGIPFSARMVVKASDDLPASLLTSLKDSKEGSEINLPTATGLTSLKVIGVEDQPMTLAQSQANIARYLTNKRVNSLVESETKRLRDSAKIEYVSPYSAVVQQK